MWKLLKLMIVDSTSLNNICRPIWLIYMLLTPTTHEREEKESNANWRWEVCRGSLFLTKCFKDLKSNNNIQGSKVEGAKTTTQRSCRIMYILIMRKFTMWNLALPLPLNIFGWQHNFHFKYLYLFEYRGRGRGEFTILCFSTWKSFFSDHTTTTRMPNISSSCLKVLLP